MDGLLLPDAVEVVNSVRGLPVADWELVTGGQVLASRGWLLAIEEILGASMAPRYLLHREGGRLAGAAICYLARSRDAALGVDGAVLGRLLPVARRLGLSLNPALVCAPYRDFGVQLFGPAREAVLAAVEAHAAGEGLPFYIRRVPDEDAELGLLLERRGYHRTADTAMVCLDIGWRDFEGYLKALGGRRRGTVRREMRRGERAGLVVRPIETPAALAGRLYELAQMHHRRWNTGELAYGPSFLPRLKELLGSACTVYGAFARGELVGFATLVRDGRVGYMQHTGIEGAARADLAYFNLVYYRPIADAIAAGLDRLCFGNGLHDTKRWRGCRVLPTSLFHKGPTPARHLLVGALLSGHRRLSSSGRASRAREDGGTVAG